MRRERRDVARDAHDDDDDDDDGDAAIGRRGRGHVSHRLGRLVEDGAELVGLAHRAQQVPVEHDERHHGHEVHNGREDDDAVDDRVHVVPVETRHAWPAHRDGGNTQSLSEAGRRVGNLENSTDLHNH